MRRITLVTGQGRSEYIRDNKGAGDICLSDAHGLEFCQELIKNNPKDTFWIESETMLPGDFFDPESNHLEHVHLGGRTDPFDLLQQDYEQENMRYEIAKLVLPLFINGDIEASAQKAIEQADALLKRLGY
jgi:hypothetical protein